MDQCSCKYPSQQIEMGMTAIARRAANLPDASNWIAQRNALGGCQAAVRR